MLPRGGDPIVGRIGDQITVVPPPPLNTKQKPAEGAKARKYDDDGGRLLVLSKTEGGQEFNYRLARYGPGVGGVESSPVAIAVADPFDACEDKAYKVS